MSIPIFCSAVVGSGMQIQSSAETLCSARSNEAVLSNHYGRYKCTLNTKLYSLDIWYLEYLIMSGPRCVSIFRVMQCSES